MKALFTETEKYTDLVTCLKKPLHHHDGCSVKLLKQNHLFA